MNLEQLKQDTTKMIWQFSIPAIISMVLTSLITIAGYVAYAFSMVIVGFGQGTSPLISFAYGAKEKILAAHIRRRTNRYVCCAGIVVFLLMAAGMEWYSRLFVRNERVEGMIQSGMLIFMTSFFFMEL